MKMDHEETVSYPWDELNRFGIDLAKTRGHYRPRDSVNVALKFQVSQAV